MLAVADDIYEKWGHVYNWSFPRFFAPEALSFYTVGQLFRKYLWIFPKMRGTVEIHDDKPYCGNKYYLPHKIVEKLESTSSPYRVVFDAGAPCPISKESLNDNILDNPRINNNLQAIEMASRFYWILILADIWKLYLQKLHNIVAIKNLDCINFV